MVRRVKRDNENLKCVRSGSEAVKKSFEKLTTKKIGEVIFEH
jgi:hypothetical protein